MCRVSRRSFANEYKRRTSIERLEVLSISRTQSLTGHRQANDGHEARATKFEKMSTGSIFTGGIAAAFLELSSIKRYFWPVHV